MPEQGGWAKDLYAAHGWSNCWGGYFGNKMPEAAPYGIVVRAPGSFGIFQPFAGVNGVRFITQDTNGRSDMKYVSTFQPPISTFPAQILLKWFPVVGIRLTILYYIEFGAPPFVYQQDRFETWTNLRKKVSVVGPGTAPLPLFSSVGPIVELTPWNRGGWQKLS